MSHLKVVCCVHGWALGSNTWEAAVLLLLGVCTLCPTVQMIRGLAQCRTQCVRSGRNVVLTRKAAGRGCPLLQPRPLSTASAGSSGAAVDPNTQPAAGRKLCVIDGHNLSWRSFFGILKSPISALQTSDGIPTTVTFGFMRTLVALLEAEQPDAVIVVFDAPGGTSFRRDLLPAYKANRVKPAPEFRVDLANLQLLLHFTRIPTLSVPGFEADDVMAGLAAQAKLEGWRTLLVSTDKDLWQVVDDAGGVAVLLPSAFGSKSGSKAESDRLVDEARVREVLGVDPHLVPDLKALMGDSSDNIPGLRGIGPKTASQLLQTHGDLDTLFKEESLAQLKPSVAGKLKGGQEQVALYKSLATVRPEAAPAYSFSAAQLPGFAVDEVEPLMRRLQMTSLVKDISRLQRVLGGPASRDPDRLAALPAALDQIAASANALKQTDEVQDGSSTGIREQQQPSAPSAALAPPSNVDATGSSLNSGAALSSGASTHQHSLADNVLASLPRVSLVSTQAALQDLVDTLQQQQAAVVWSWPQTTPYQPGCRQQPPQVLCCAWHPAGQPASIPASQVTQSSSTPGHTAAAAAAAAATPVVRRRRRRTTRVGAAPLQPQVQEAPNTTPAPGGQPQPQAPGVSQQGSNSAGLQLAVVLPGPDLPVSAVLSAIKPLLESTCHPKCLFESKRCFTEMHHQGIKMSGVEYDVLVAGCLPDPQRWIEVLNPECQQQSVLPAMAQHVLNTSLADMAAALSSSFQGRAAADFNGGPVSIWQAAAEAWATLLLQDSFTAMMQRLDDGGQLQALLSTVEVPLQRVLSDMEVTGVRCDKQLLAQQRDQLQVEVRSLQEQLYTIAGCVFNPNSPKECSSVIYDRLKLTGKGIKRTKSGYYSTSMSEIEKLEASPFKAAFIEWSRLSSLLSKYYSGTYLAAINSDTGRVHTTYHQVGVATGRLATSNPNMQSVPAHDERGRLFRAAFTADEGHVLVAADYSQVELRVMAALSGDEALLKAFAAGQDVHAATAREMLGKGPQDTVTAEERQLGKRLNFSLVYGAGARMLAAELGTTSKEAQLFQDKFREAHPKLYEYKTYCMRSAVARGFTRSAAGRRRLYTFRSEGLRQLRGAVDLEAMPDMKGLQKLADREDVHTLLQASNAPIQSSSADVLKAALIQLHSMLGPPPYCCRLLLTVHDDVLLEVPSSQWPAVKGVVERSMETALPQLGLMLKADVSSGVSWLDCK